MQVGLRLVKEMDVVSVYQVIQDSRFLEECNGAAGLIDSFQVEAVLPGLAGEEDVFRLPGALELNRVLVMEIYNIEVRFLDHLQEELLHLRIFLHLVHHICECLVLIVIFVDSVHGSGNPCKEF